MTKDKLLQRIDELRAQKEQAIANANACAGAIGDCEYWLAQLAIPQAEP